MRAFLGENSVRRHFRVVAAVRPLHDRERALQHVALLGVVAQGRRTRSRGSNSVRATCGWSRPYARSLIASARSSMSRFFAWSPKSPYAFPRFPSVVATSGWSRPYARSLIASARSSMSRCLGVVAQFAVRAPRFPSVMATFAWSRPYARSLIASARSSMSRFFAWSPKAPYAFPRFGPA